VTGSGAATTASGTAPGRGGRELSGGPGGPGRASGGHGAGERWAAGDRHGVPGGRVPAGAGHGLPGPGSAAGLPGDDGRGFGPGRGFAGGLPGRAHRDGAAGTFGADLAGGLPMAGLWRAPATADVLAGHFGAGHAGPGHPTSAPAGLGRDGGAAGGGAGRAGSTATHRDPAAGTGTGRAGTDGPSGLGRLRRALARAGGLADRLTRAAGRRHGTLTAAPPAGPSVHNPDPVGYLRVLGGAPLPPGQVPDPAGAVQLSPAAGHRAGPTTQRAGGGHAHGPVPDLSPRQRWEAAVAARPLESPRPLPAALHAMAAAITGRARPPHYTTGPATRHALAAAGALGATTGTVVHLPAPPVPGPSVSAVLAHELTHTRNPVRRPRFFLGGASALLDDDERSALAAGRQQLSGVADQGRDAAAGIVNQLPVGGGLGAIGDVATRAARAAVMEAAAGPMAAAQGFAGNAMSAASGAMNTVSGALDTASGAVDTVAGAASGAVDAVGGAASGLASQAAGAAGQVASAAKAALDPDKVVEIVEQRLLREIERRGGRWAGVF
jgi:hypothetical protein